MLTILNNSVFVYDKLVSELLKLLLINVVFVNNVLINNPEFTVELSISNLFIEVYKGKLSATEYVPQDNRGVINIGFDSVIVELFISISVIT